VTAPAVSLARWRRGLVLRCTCGAETLVRATQAASFAELLHRRGCPLSPAESPRQRKFQERRAAVIAAKRTRNAVSQIEEGVAL